MTWLLLSLSLARAGSTSTTFDTDAGDWQGGTVVDGVLTVTSDQARLELGTLTSLSAQLRLRHVDSGTLSLSVGDQTWAIDYESASGITLGSSALVLPHGHRAFTPDADPVLTANPAPGAEWEAGGVLHSDIVYDDRTGTWFYYYTGIMSPGYGYRQIGLATSTDGASWTRHTQNPVLTIDYDLTAVDGVHVHMPSVAIHPTDGTWHMVYSCYQNDVGNRLCYATSADGFDWTPQGVALDRGEAGAFDSASLREPDLTIDSDGVFHLLYQGTQGDEHYGPTGYATRTIDTPWTRHGALSGTGPSVLQGGGVLQNEYGLEQWYNCDDMLCYAASNTTDWTTWNVDTTPDLRKNWAVWNSGYLQGATPWQVDQSIHLWFNAYDYGTGLESLGHAVSEPAPGAWADVSLTWADSVLTVTFDDGPPLTAPLAAADGLVLTSTGTTEVDSFTANWSSPTIDTGDPIEDSATEDSATEDSLPSDTSTPEADSGSENGVSAQDGSKDAGCGGCGGAAAWLWLPVSLGLARRREQKRTSPGAIGN